MPEVVFVDVFSRTGNWACPFPLNLITGWVGDAFSRRHRPIAYVVEDGFRLFIPVEDGWVKRAVNIETFDDNHPLLRLHDSLVSNDGPVPAPPESRPRLPGAAGDLEGSEHLLVLIEDCWQTYVAGNTRSFVGLDEVGQPLYASP